MSFRSKKWTTLGTGLAVLGATSLAACGSDEAPAEDETALVTEGEEAEPATELGEFGEGEGGEAGEGEGGEGGEAGLNLETLPRPFRLAFMAGHVEAGLALYRAGEPAMAAPHLLHPVSETHAEERGGLEELGFDASLFEAVSTALEAGETADDVEAQLTAAEQNLTMVAERAGGNPVEIVEFLMQTVVDEYGIGVPADTVTDIGEYQDAYGFVVVAIDQAERFEGEAGERVRAELQTLIEMWPGTPPVPTDDPVPASVINAQVSTVLLELSGVR
ncbi:MAG: hypothetical protein AAF683_12220 [Pseudomonadota bacterium]